MLRCFIAEDEAPARQRLQRLLGQPPGVCVVVLIDDRELLLDDALDQLQQRFDPDQFLRVHRSAIINIARLRELVHEGDRRYVAVLADAAATRVPVSRDRLPALRVALGLE